jgi:hypothetical protein
MFGPPGSSRQQARLCAFQLANWREPAVRTTTSIAIGTWTTVVVAR